MIYKRGHTYWYKFSWSLKQSDGTSVASISNLPVPQPEQQPTANFSRAN